jgi:hypothetical protein
MAGRSTETQVSLKINGKEASNTIAGLQSDVKTLSRELSKLPEGTEEFNQKAKELAQAQNRLQDIRDKAREVREQMRSMGDDAKKARADLLQLSPTGQMLSGLAQDFGTVRSAINANIASMGLLRVAIIATGIGALIVALGALYTYFTRTDDGAVKLAGATKGLQIIFKSLTDLVAQLGEWLINAFENPKQAIKELGDFILTNLINRVKAFAVIFEAIAEMDLKKLTDGTIQLSTGVENVTDKVKEFGKEVDAAVQKGLAFAELADRIDEVETKSIVTNAKIEEQVSRLLLQAKDRTKTEGERLALLDRASALETQRLQETINLQALKVQLAKEDLASVSKTSAEYDDKNRALAEAEAKLIELRRSSLDLQEKITNRRNQLLDASAEKAKAMREAEEKAEEDAAKAALDYERRLTDLRIANLVDEDERKRVIILNNYKRGLEDALLNGQLTKELETELLKARDQQLQALEDEIQARKEKAQQDKEEMALKDEDAKMQAETEARLLAANAVVEAEANKEQRIYDVMRTGLLNRLELLRTAGKLESDEAKKLANEITKLDLDHSKKRQEIATKTAETEDRLQSARLQLFADTTKGISAFLGEDANNRRRFAGIIKAMTIAEIVTMGIKEVQGIWSNANMNALNAIIPGWGPAFAAVQSAMAIGRTTFAVTNAAGINFFQDGGILRTGSRHRDGGIKMIDGKSGQYLGEVEQGEALHVYSRKTVENNGDIINALLDTSMFRGGARLKSTRGGYFENGGTVQTGSGNAPQAQTNEALVAMQLEKLDRIAAILESWPSNVRAILTYEQVKDLLNDAADIENGANAA